MESVILMDHIFGIINSDQLVIVSPVSCQVQVLPLVSGLELMEMIQLTVLVTMIMIHSVAIIKTYLMLHSACTLIRNFQLIKKDFTNAVYPLAVQIPALVSSQLIFSVRNTIIEKVFIIISFLQSLCK